MSYPREVIFRTVVALAKWCGELTRSLRELSERLGKSDASTAELLGRVAALDVRVVDLGASLTELAGACEKLGAVSMSILDRVEAEEDRSATTSELLSALAARADAQEERQDVFARTLRELAE